MGNDTPERVKPVPLTAAALTVTGAVPVDDSVTDWVADVLRFTFPNATVVALMLSVGTPAPSSRVKVCATPAALAVKVTVCDELTALTVAVKLPVVAPEATVTLAGTVTRELLLVRLTVNPPLTAAAFSVTVQPSVPAALIDPFVQLNALSTGTPLPLRLMTVDAPVVELLANVNEPDAGPDAVGSNCKVNAAVWFGFSVSGKVAPETENPLPLTVAPVIVTAAAPVEVKVKV